MTIADIRIFDHFLFQMPNRIHCTWMGDPSKVILLEAVLDTIAKDNLQQVVNDSGKVLLEGLNELQVRGINLGHLSPGTPRTTPVPIWFSTIWWPRANNHPSVVSWHKASLTTPVNFRSTFCWLVKTNDFVNIFWTHQQQHWNILARWDNVVSLKRIGVKYLEEMFDWLLKSLFNSIDQSKTVKEGGSTPRVKNELVNKILTNAVSLDLISE